jgi:hypothetical protein
MDGVKSKNLFGQYVLNMSSDKEIFLFQFYDF